MHRFTSALERGIVAINNARPGCQDSVLFAEPHRYTYKSMHLQIDTPTIGEIGHGDFRRHDAQSSPVTSGDGCGCYECNVATEQSAAYREYGQAAILAHQKNVHQNHPSFWEQWYTHCMSYELTEESSYSSAPQRPRIWLERLLLAAFLFCLFIGLGALAIFLIMRNNAQPSLNADPLQSVRQNLVTSHIALRELSGDPAAGLVSQLLQAGHLETARSILTFATDISSIERAARLATLARAYLVANEPEAAGQVYVLLVSTAILEDSIPILERVNLLTQSADGLTEAGFPDAAGEAATQAMRIAAQSPGLLPAQRIALFSDLRLVAEQLPSSNAAKKSLQALLADYVRNPYLTGAGIVITPTLATFPQQIPYDSTTQEKLAARHQAARILADRIDFTGGVDIEPERQALAQALLEEDQARAQFYQNPGEISRGQQLWLLLDRRAWLIEKLRIALGGYGMTISPEWEAQIGAIRSELTTANGFLNSVMAAYAADQPNALEKTLLQIETQHWLATQAMRGLYPNAPTGNISELLRSLQDDLKRQGAPLALPIIYEGNANPPGFRIQPAP